MKKYGSSVVFGRVAEHAGDRDCGLLERIRPVLGADPGPEQRMLGRRDVADREDVGIAGAQRRVDEHAAVGPIVRPAACGEVGVRRRADRDEDGVGIDGGPVTEAQPGRGAVGGGDLLDL